MLARTCLLRPLCALYYLVLLPVNVYSAVITVDTTGDTGAAKASCELRSAIEAANTDSVVDGCASGSGDDTIEFSVTGNISLSSDLPGITGGVIIDGPGKTLLAIDGGGLYRQFHFLPSSSQHEIRDLVVAKGQSSDVGGCMRTNANHLLIEDMVFSKCHSDSDGGALAAITTTEIQRSLFQSNSADFRAGAVLLSTGTKLVFDSSFESNNSANGGAMAIIGAADVMVTRSTFNNNAASVSGGAIYISVSTASINFVSSTISGNKADSDSNSSGHGGGIYNNSGSLTLENTIVSDNIDANLLGTAPDIGAITPTAMNSNGYNLIGNNSTVTAHFPAGNPNETINDWVGTSAKPLSAELLAFGDHVGPTPTMPPGGESIVIDNGNCPGELADQRGLFDWDTGFRVIDTARANAADGCDIGAVEWPVLRPILLRDGFE